MKNKRILKQLSFLVIILAVGYGYSIYSSESKQFSSREHRKAMAQDLIDTTEGALEAKVRYRGPSQYGEIVVFDYQDRVRCFLVDGANESCWVFPQEIPSTYTRHIAEFMGNMDSHKQISNVLVIGFGGGTLFKTLGETDYPVDIVEINKELPEISKKYFFHDLESNHKLTISDGRFFLEDSNEKYDLIVLDICNVTDYSLHLWTSEFYRIASDHLTKNGSLIVSRNIVNTDDNYELDGMIAKAMLESFDRVMRVEGDDISVGEYDVGVFIAKKGSELPFDKLSDRAIVSWLYDVNAEVLRDQNSPSALSLFYPTTVAIKNQVIENFGKELLFQ